MSEQEKDKEDKFCAGKEEIDALLRTMKAGKKDDKEKPKPPKVVEGNQKNKS